MSGWPWPRDSALTRRTKVAIAYRNHLHVANPTVGDVLDDTMREYGQTWVLPAVLTVDDVTCVTTADAARLAGVQPETIRKWRRRGYIDETGVRQFLQLAGLSEQGWPMFSAVEVMAIAAWLHRRRAA